MSDTIGAVRACGYRIIIDPESQETTTESGIVIPARERAEQEAGEIVAVGPLAWKDYGDGTPWAKVGDRVLYSKYGGKMVTDPDTKKMYKVANDEDIICVISSDKPIDQEHYDGAVTAGDLE